MEHAPIQKSLTIRTFKSVNDRGEPTALATLYNGSLTTISPTGVIEHVGNVEHFDKLEGQAPIEISEKDYEEIYQGWIGNWGLQNAQRSEDDQLPHVKGFSGPVLGLANVPGGVMTTDAGIVPGDLALGTALAAEPPFSFPDNAPQQVPESQQAADEPISDTEPVSETTESAETEEGTKPEAAA